jgi:Ni,Fe-hydrogenase III large subunit
VRTNDRVFGTRLLRNTVAVGGVRRDLQPEGRELLRTQLRAFEKEFDRLVGLLLDAGTFTDRVDGTGILTHQAAQDLGIVGVAARASGIDADLRRDHPHDAYADLQFLVPVEEGGDVRARLMVRAREVVQSLRILHQVLDQLPDTPCVTGLPGRLPPHASALGWAEAWRGPCTHWVTTDERGEVARVKVTDPSFLNWPGLVHAVPGNIIPDFPVINKSFNLSYSGNDR